MFGVYRTAPALVGDAVAGGHHLALGPDADAQALGRNPAPVLMAPLLLMSGVARQRGEWGFMLAGGVLTLVMAAAAAATLEPTIQALRARIRHASMGAAS